MNKIATILFLAETVLTTGILFIFLHCNSFVFIFLTEIEKDIYLKKIQAEGKEKKKLKQCSGDAILNMYI